jgi:hypothetical protein
VVSGECWASQRGCGHHCNCSWVHDACHWCGKVVDLDGTWPEGLREEANPRAFKPTAMCGATKKCPSCPSTFLCQMKVDGEARLIRERGTDV